MKIFRRRSKVGLRLGELLIDLRRVNLGQQLTLFDVGPDVEVPVLEVSIRSGVNWRIDEGLNVARQQDLLRRRTLFRLNDQNGWRGQFAGLRSQGLARPQPWDDTDGHK